MFSRTAMFCAFLLLTIVGDGEAVRADDTPSLPKATKLLTAPTAAERVPRARVMLAGYRYDDLLWENDYTAHRIYGHALEAAQPPSGSGIDAWGKNVAWPFMDRQLRTGDQHVFQGEGIDFYHVGTARGAGGLGVWFDNKLWTSRNYRTFKIFKDGPDVADFEVNYAPWPVDTGRRVWETRRFTLPLGTPFTRMVSTISSNRQEPLIIGIGISKLSIGERPGQFTLSREHGTLSFWGSEDADHGTMGVGLRVDPKLIVDIREDLDDYLILIKVQPGHPFVYYSGSVWSKGVAGIRTREQWDRRVESASVDFNPAAH